ncbi:MAG: prepilin-type N-terminal cleavage/methylation domain-containing protein [Armatimonadetes bacterium]|nr:prepilin-type N-terminal cleavage/methylation domain-containing protein [Armatimonadota bacterium]
MSITGRKKGFTLIELLVVIAIIAILAAILFPIFVTAKDRAKLGACINQQKQLAGAFLRYTSDWNEMSCQVYDERGVYWGQKMASYLGKSIAVVYCPASPYRGARSGIPPDWVAGWSSIGMNVIFGNNYSIVAPIKMSEIVSITKTILFCDTSFSNYPGYESTDIGAYCATPGRSTEPLLCMAPRVNSAGTWTFSTLSLKRHNGRTVVTHTDGHVGTYATNKLLTANGTRKDYKLPNFSMWDMY